MKKAIKIVLVVILAVYATFMTGVVFIAAGYQTELESENAELSKKYDSLNESSDELIKTWEEIQPGYQEYLKWKEQNTLDSLNTVAFEAWAKCISEKYCVYEVDAETVMVVVYTEGRSTDAMIEDISANASMFAIALKTVEEYENGILVVVNDDSDVLFGYTVSVSGDVSMFVSEDGL